MTFITEKRDKLSRGWFVIMGADVVVMVVGVVLAARGALDPPVPSPVPAAEAAPAAPATRPPAAPPATLAATFSEECQRKGLGKSERDILGARAMCAVFEPTGSLDQIELIRVDDTMATMNITRGLYDTLSRDRASGQARVAGLLESLRQTSGAPAVTVWIYADRVRVLEGDTNNGEPRVKFLVD